VDRSFSIRLPQSQYELNLNPNVPILNDSRELNDSEKVQVNLEDPASAVKEGSLL
jgi:hypothetical protein